ncbi:hypothetical protein IQ07DRAFT_673024, partial [Pyrenochaeta sp. DS3sAY3a]
TQSRHLSQHQHPSSRSSDELSGCERPPDPPDAPCTSAHRDPRSCKPSACSLRPVTSTPRPPIAGLLDQDSWANRQHQENPKHHGSILGIEFQSPPGAEWRCKGILGIFVRSSRERTSSRVALTSFVAERGDPRRTLAMIASPSKSTPGDKNPMQTCRRVISLQSVRNVSRLGAELTKRIHIKAGRSNKLQSSNAARACVLADVSIFSFYTPDGSRLPSLIMLCRCTPSSLGYPVRMVHSLSGRHGSPSSLAGSLSTLQPHHMGACALLVACCASHVGGVTAAMQCRIWGRTSRLTWDWKL